MTPPRPPKHIQTLTPYQPGRSVEEIREELGLERIIKLASNENPLGSSPRAVERMREAAGRVDTYPRAGLALRGELARILGLDMREITAASGSEGVMLTAMRAFLQPGDEVVTAEGTFIGLYVIANAMKLRLTTVPLTPEYTFDLDAILEAVTPATRMIYVANPNNPTGTAFGREAWARFIERLPEDVLVIMDEAYFEYARDLRPEDYPNSLETRHDQVLTLRTFSKAYGLAGVRIGYGVGHPDVISTLMKVKLPFEPSAVAEAAGLGALEDDLFLQQSLEVNRKGMARLHRTLEEMGEPHTESIANFSLLPRPSAEDAARLSDELLQRGIIARPMVPFRLPHCVRITIGTPEQMDVLIPALQEILRG